MLYLSLNFIINITLPKPLKYGTLLQRGHKITKKLDFYKIIIYN